MRNAEIRGVWRKIIGHAGWGTAEKSRVRLELECGHKFLVDPETPTNPAQPDHLWSKSDKSFFCTRCNPDKVDDLGNPL